MYRKASSVSIKVFLHMPSYRWDMRQKKNIQNNEEIPKIYGKRLNHWSWSAVIVEKNVAVLDKG